MKDTIMIHHIVLFKWKDGTEKSKINDVVRSLNSLKNIVPSILEIQVSENFSDRSGGYSHVLVSKFVSKESLDQYQNHPEHQKVVKDKIKPIVDSTLVGDIQI